MEKPNSVECVIANGATGLSGACPLGNGALSRIVMPDAWIAANLTFQTSYDGVTFTNLYDSTGTEYTVVAASGRAIIIPLADFLGVRFIKVRSGTSGTPVNQTADRTLRLIVQP